MEDNKDLDTKTKKQDTKRKVVRAIIVVTITVLVLFLLYLGLNSTGMLSKISTVDELKELILSYGNMSYIIFILIQFLQVTFIPIPAIITTVAGAYVFGNFQTLVISLITVWLGSAFAFWLGRKLGRPLLSWVAGDEDADKWINKLGRGKYFFFFMMLFPGFPDDILCIAAGATSMSFKFFMVTNFITRPVAFITMIYVTTGSIIPFSGWGIPVWGLIVLFMACMFYWSIKYEKEIEQYLVDKSKKMELFFKNMFSKNK